MRIAGVVGEEIVDEDVVDEVVADEDVVDEVVALFRRFGIRRKLVQVRPICAYMQPFVHISGRHWSRK